MSERERVVLDLSKREMAVLKELAARGDLSKAAILRQSLKLYQLVDTRVRNGESLMFSGDKNLTIEFIGIGLGDPS